MFSWLSGLSLSLMSFAAHSMRKGAAKFNCSALLSFPSDTGSAVVKHSLRMQWSGSIKFVRYSCSLLFQAAAFRGTMPPYEIIEADPETDPIYEVAEDVQQTSAVLVLASGCADAEDNKFYKDLAVPTPPSEEQPQEW